MIEKLRFQATTGRREFIGSIAAVAAGSGILAGCAGSQSARLARQVGGRPMRKPGKSTVQFRTGSDRYKTITDALEPLREQVAGEIGTKQVIVKVNAGLVDPEYANYSTHADELRAILDFLKPIHDGQILVSEGTASKAQTIMPAYENYGYMPFADRYNIKFIDANEQPTERVFIHAAKQHPVPINVIYPYMDPNVYLISAARMKTHNAVVGTFSLKNVVMGSPQCRFWLKGTSSQVSDKPLMHGRPGLPEESSGRELSYNLFTLALAGVRPDLAIVDGIQSIEGNGPWNGEVVEHKVVVASTDFVACDRLCTELIGIDPFYMKYMEFCGDAGMGNWNLENISVEGPNWERNIRKYKLNDSVGNQIAWIDRNFER